LLKRHTHPKNIEVFFIFGFMKIIHKKAHCN
jgi:hypothetical protein